MQTDQGVAVVRPELVDQRLDRGAFSSRKSGRAWNRTAASLEQHIVALRTSLREESVLGEYGARAIQVALQAEAKAEAEGEGVRPILYS